MANNFNNQGPNPGGIVLNTRTISAIVGVIAIIGAVFTVFDKVNSYEYRLTKVEQVSVSQSTELKTLTSELKVLNSKLTDLTIELKEMRAEYNTYFRGSKVFK